MIAPDIAFLMKAKLLSKRSFARKTCESFALDPARKYFIKTHSPVWEIVSFEDSVQLTESNNPLCFFAFCISKH